MTMNALICWLSTQHGIDISNNLPLQMRLLVDDGSGVKIAYWPWAFSQPTEADLPDTATVMAWQQSTKPTDLKTLENALIGKLKKEKDQDNKPYLDPAATKMPPGLVKKAILSELAKGKNKPTPEGSEVASRLTMLRLAIEWLDGDADDVQWHPEVEQ